MRLAPARTNRLNIRLDDKEYDAVYKFARENGCRTLDEAVRKMIEKCTMGSGAKSVHTTNSDGVIM